MTGSSTNDGQLLRKFDGKGHQHYTYYTAVPRLAIPTCAVPSMSAVVWVFRDYLFTLSRTYPSYTSASLK